MASCLGQAINSLSKWEFLREKNRWHCESESKGFRFRYQFWSSNFPVTSSDPKFWSMPATAFFQNGGPCPIIQNPQPAHRKFSGNSCATVSKFKMSYSSSLSPGKITKLAIIKSVSNEYTSRIKAKEKGQATPEQRRGIKEIQAHHSIAKAKTTLRCQALLTTSGIRPQASLGGHDWNADILKPSSCIQKETSSTSQISVELEGLSGMTPSLFWNEPIRG